MRRDQGQSLVESAFALVVFFAMLIGALDVAQVVFAHQALVERVNRAVRWGVVHPWQGADPIRNLVLYDRAEEPEAAAPGYLGLKPENVNVTYRAPTVERPDDETLTVEIVNFETHLFSPWIAQALVSPRPVLISAPVSFRSPAAD